MNTTAERAIKILEVYPYLRVRGAAQAIDFYSPGYSARLSHFGSLMERDASATRSSRSERWC